MCAGMFKGAPGVWVRLPLAVPFNSQGTVTEILRPWEVEGRRGDGRQTRTGRPSPRLHR